MLKVELDQDHGIAILIPDGALEQRDFEAAAELIDPFIKQVGKLRGVIVYVDRFPGWNSFAALATHLRFVKDHHRYIARVALVTDSALGDVAEHLVDHFVAADVKHFPYAGFDDAMAWIAAAH